VKAELGEDGLPMGGRHAEVPAAEHGYGWSVSAMKAEVKTENNVDLRVESLVNVKIKTETGTPAHGLAEGIVDAGGERRVQPTRGVKRRVVSYTDDDVGSAGGSAADEEWTSAPRRWRKGARVTDAAQGAVVRLAHEETADRLASDSATSSDEALPAVVGAGRRRSDAGWEAQLAKLKAYKGKHDNCNVPARWAEDPQLGRWVCAQRECKKALDRGDPSHRMTAARAAKLVALGCGWELPRSGGGPSDGAGWEAQLAKLKAYKQRHGDCNVPQGWEDPRLGKWVVNQRQYKKVLDRGEPSHGMTSARAVKLDALGFAWELSAAAISKQCSNAKRNDVEWEAQLAKLKAYKRRHGDCNVLRFWTEDPSLGRWVNTQRSYKKKLDHGDPMSTIMAARVAKLEALGFSWQRDQDAWEAQVAKLSAYKAAHGDCNVPRSWSLDPGLGIWVSHQREFKKKLDRGERKRGMTAARAAKLEALGFEWEMSSRCPPNDEGWEMQIAKLSVYKAAHGDCNVPQRWSEDRTLGRWVSDQRKYKKKLDRGEPSHGMTSARAVKLNALGFVWELSAAAISKQMSEGQRDDAGWEAQLAKLNVYERRHGSA
jgi:hypothetical protein